MEYAILIDNVTFYYEGSDEPAIKNISLKIKEGEFVLITGPSGCGKSTLCRLLNGLIPHFYTGRLEGNVKIYNLDTRKTPTHILARYVGMVFQNPENQLFLSSVRKEIIFGLENLGLSKEEIKKRFNRIVKLFNLEKILDKPPYELSGGQQQKVAIAAVVAMEPKILVLDEPTSNLDPVTAQEIITIVNELNKVMKITIVMVEHRLDLVCPLVDRIIVMKNGRIIYDGKPKEFFRKVKFETCEINIPKVVEAYSKLRNYINFNNVPLSPNELANEIKSKIGRIK